MVDENIDYVLVCSEIDCYQFPIGCRLACTASNVVFTELKTTVFGRHYNLFLCSATCCVRVAPKRTERILLSNPKTNVECIGL